MGAREYPQYLIALIRTFYKKGESKMQINDEIIPKKFQARREIKQKCVS